MRKLLLFAALALVSGRTHAAENYVIDLDWNDSSTLNGSVTQMCDDTYYPAVDIVVPGVPNKNFDIQMEVSFASGKLSPACSVKRKLGKTKTTYSINATDGSCTIKVYQYRPANGQKPKVATYEINDAC